MKPTLEIVQDRLSIMLPAYAAAMEQSMPDCIRTAAKSAISNSKKNGLLQITPPMSAGVQGLAAQAQGKLRIARQMHHIFRPVPLKGHREIKVVFGHHLAHPISVPTKELHPDVRGLYREQTRPGASFLGVRLKNPNARFFVDERKFEALLQSKQAAVGKLASAWCAAASALGIPVPAWIAKHGTSNGLYIEQFGSDKPFALLGGNIPSTMAPQMATKYLALFTYALAYAHNNLVRKARGYLRSKGQESGFTVSQIETGNFVDFGGPGGGDG